jgi:site-specific recombinase XerC
MLIDTGGRISEIAGLMTDDIDFKAGAAHVLGKGRRERALAIPVHGEATSREADKPPTRYQTGALP